MKKNFDFNYIQKMKELKTWTEVKSPAILRPALSYALDWLSPELLGSGVYFQMLSDDKIQAMIPFKKSNCDLENQIHLGLVVNVGHELVKKFLAHHWTESQIKFENLQLQISKNQKWDKDIKVFFETSESLTDDFFHRLQKNQRAQLIVKAFVQIGQTKKMDELHLQLDVVKTPLLQKSN